MPENVILVRDLDTKMAAAISVLVCASVTCSLIGSIGGDPQAYHRERRQRAPPEPCISFNLYRRRGPASTSD
jgi:hypothetical protein